jgi:protoheme IX farnesyltransferase
VLVYTVWLKRRTPQNIVIGGAAGAFPPLIGWAAATGDVDPAAAAAVRAHLPVDAAAFLGAVAVRPLRLRRAGVPMLPVVAGAKVTRQQIALYTCRWPPRGRALAARAAGAIYGVAAPRSAVFLAAGSGARQPRDRARRHEARRSGCSLFDPLPVRLFGALVADRWLLA